jgi:hypothetical protein
MSAKVAVTARAIADEVLGRSMTREVWTGNYDKVLPVSVQDFDLTAVLPAVFYMFRFGYRRGKGKFLETFSAASGTMRDKKQAATIDRVAGNLAALPTFMGFDGETKQSILGDLLLSYCLENASHALGRKEQILRVAPAHYMAGWVDLPQSVSHLRFVPEMLTAILANQEGPCVEQNRDGDKTWFAVGHGFEDNVLLKVFHKGVVREGELGSRKADTFDETADVGLDQLLMIRLAQQLGEAPGKLRGQASGADKISNQRPIAELASRHFSEDLRHFILGYAEVIPRHSFVEMLESCMALGLTSILTSVIELLFEWVYSGTVRNIYDQRPALLLVDCSNGVDRRLRAVAEQSMDDFTRRIERLPVVFMALRLLDHGVSDDPNLKRMKTPTRPYATEWLKLLGDILHQRREEARDVLRDLGRISNKLATAFKEEYPEASAILENEESQPNPVWRIAEALTLLQGRGNTQKNLLKLIDSALMVGRPHGLATKRGVIRAAVGSGRKKRDVRSLVFTDAVLDHLVHLHVLRTGRKLGYRPLPFTEFLARLRARYGFCVDVAPPGLTVSNDLLQDNRVVLERRLRDLGLLVGVNDAEAMKHLKPRFEPSRGINHDVD